MEISVLNSACAAAGLEYHDSVTLTAASASVASLVKMPGSLLKSLPAL